MTHPEIPDKVQDVANAASVSRLSNTSGIEVTEGMVEAAIAYAYDSGLLAEYETANRLIFRHLLEASLARAEAA